MCFIIALVLVGKHEVHVCRTQRENLLFLIKSLCRGKRTSELSSLELVM